MKFYTVSDTYIDYLKTIDSNVLNNYQGQRPYIGIILDINGTKFLAPLTSYKPKQDKIKNSPACLKIHARLDPSDKLGMVKLNNMIPVNDEVISLLDIEAQDEKYKGLLYKQFEFLKLNKAILIDKSSKIYDLVTNKKHPFFSKISCDFKALEIEMNNYDDSSLKTK